MPRVPLIALEVFLGGVVPIAWGVWELLSLRRDRRRRERASSVSAAASGAKKDLPSLPA